jgi:iron complex outermembrane receptor protein
MTLKRQKVISQARLSALLLGASVWPLMAANAQDVSRESTVYDEIVVTAQKRDERISDVPMSITAASGEQLMKQRIFETSQLTKLVPGFAYQVSNYGPPIFSIRGVGFIDYSVTSGPTVTAYIDQVPLPYSTMTRGATLDLERVEVLKGPQGTLFGQNSTGGAINYIAARPTETLEAGVDLSYGRYNEVIAGGFISGPLSDKVRARLVGRHEYMDGWQKSLTRPEDRQGKKRFYNGRLLVDWDAAEDLKFQLNISGWQDQSDIPAGQLMAVIPQAPLTVRSAPFVEELAMSPLPTRLREADWDPDKDFQRNNKFYLFSLRGDWQINDDVALTSITAYSHMTTHQPIDVDGSAVSNFSFLRQDGLLKSFSQELRLSGEVGPVLWMIGGNYQHQTANEFQLLDNAGSQGALDLTPFAFALEPELAKVWFWDLSSYLNNQRPISKSVFGSIDYSVTDQVTLRASARYNDERRRFNGCLADGGGEQTEDFDPIRDAFAALSTALTGVPVTIEPFGCLTFSDATLMPALVQTSLNEDNFSWRVGVDWKLNPDTLLYVTVAKGYKAGSFTVIPSILASQLEPVTQESLLSYEAGFKLSAAERRVQLSGAAFYYDYTDKQFLNYVDTPFGRLPKLINFPKSRVWGLELETTLYPVDGLRMSGGVTYVSSKVKKDPASGVVDPLGNAVPFVGQAFPNTPKWQGVGDAEYNFPMGNNANLFIGGTLSVRSKSYANFGELPQFILPSYALIDLRGGIESADGKWRAQLYGNNITNKWYWQNVFITTDALVKTPAMGATYGLALSYRL